MGTRAAQEVMGSSLNLKEERGRGSQGHEEVTKETSEIAAMREKPDSILVSEENKSVLFSKSIILHLD